MQTSQSKLTNWNVGGASVLGASHVRQGVPNQDAIAWWPESGQGLPLILAIADGHGSAKSFRSQQGSAMAVQVAISVLTNHLHLNQPQQLQARSRNLQLLEQTLQQELPQQLVQTWQDQVFEDLEAHPFTPTELQKLQTKDGEAACERLHHNPLLAYGATLLTVVVTPQFILYLQLGDGDILCVDAQGQPHRPLPVDPNLIANETTSLCMPHAWDWLRLSLTPTQAAPQLIPQLILVSTDGYSNSFVSEADFCQVGPDYFYMLQEQGFADVLSQLPSILQETSQQGSGDDITLGVIARNTASPNQNGPRGQSTLIQSQTPSRLRQPSQFGHTSSTGFNQHPPESTPQVPGHTRLSAISANRDKNASRQGITTQFQAPSSSAPPVPPEPVPIAHNASSASSAHSASSASGLPSATLVDQAGTAHQLQQLQHANHKLRRQLLQLRLGLFLSLGVTVISLGVAAYALWQNRESILPSVSPPSSTPSAPSSQPSTPTSEPANPQDGSVNPQTQPPQNSPTNPARPRRAPGVDDAGGLVEQDSGSPPNQSNSPESRDGSRP
jgi:serine/threonine protein phosphatase PrpC